MTRLDGLIDTLKKVTFVCQDEAGEAFPTLSAQLIIKVTLGVHVYCVCVCVCVCVCHGV